ncbi:Glutaredoxin-1 [Nosema granulosis]|uniref:Glutaredoxin-1 n=1 Tax=Nosema granulosis TaxID=83296 RepID=A0A9P6H128_9MICR|nr:Glutaredoxin-1 [Nosema granulosis]
MLPILLILSTVYTKIIVKREDSVLEYNSKFEKLLNKDYIVILYKSRCPYSLNTIKTLTDKKIPFTKYERSQNPELSTYANKKYNYTKSPLIVIGGKFFGGDSTLQDAFENDPQFLSWPNVREF